MAPTSDLPNSIVEAVTTLAGEMKAARTAQRLSLRAVATKVGITSPTYAQIEKGNLNVNLSTYLRCVHFFGMSDNFFNALVAISGENRPPATGDMSPMEEQSTKD